MKLPVGTLKGEALNNFLYTSMQENVQAYYQKFAEYDPEFLFTNWKKLIRCIDEFINIPFENKHEEFIALYYCFKAEKEYKNDHIEKILVEEITANFDSQVSDRFIEFSLMCSRLNKRLTASKYFDRSGGQMNLSNTKNRIDYFQSRRKYFITTLFMIPKLAKGKKKSHFNDLLDDFFTPVDGCLVNVTTCFYKILINNSISYYEMRFDQKQQIGIGNFQFDHLEDFYLNPQRLSMLDQLEFRREEIGKLNQLSKVRNKIFSFSEIANGMNLMQEIFEKYQISDMPIYTSLNNLFLKIGAFIIDDYDITIGAAEFDRLTTQFRDLKLYNQSVEYFENLNSISPFQKMGDNYYSTIVLLDRYAHNLVLNALLRNRRFQVNSGFVFEDKVSSILEDNGFKDLKITRIGRKEFDVVAIKSKQFNIEASKDDKIYNFQCKNNYYDISEVSSSAKILAGLNRRLCSYYEKALLKEEKREQLLIDKTGLDEIEHFIVSRFPVISSNSNIINFNRFEYVVRDLL